MVLVTGATGLVGSHLVLRLLEDNQKVRALCRNTAATQKVAALFESYGKRSLFDAIDWIEADITDVPSLEKAFPGIEGVYHCAAYISFDPADEDLLRKINIEGTANIVNLCLDYGVKKICHVSSIAALGDLKEGEITITEQTEWNPEITHSDYAISKHGAEMEVWRAQQEGLAVTIVNPGVIIGPGFWHSGSGLLFEEMARGLSFFTKGTTGFVSVADVTKSLIQCMDRENDGKQFIVVAENSSYENFLKSVASALHVKAPRFYAKPWMTSLYWRMDALVCALSGRKRTMSRQMARSLHETHCFSNAKIKSELGFEFQDMQQAITETAKHYRT